MAAGWLAGWLCVSLCMVRACATARSRTTCGCCCCRSTARWAPSSPPSPTTTTSRSSRSVVGASPTLAGWLGKQQHRRQASGRQAGRQLTGWLAGLSSSSCVVGGCSDPGGDAELAAAAGLPAARVLHRGQGQVPPTSYHLLAPNHTSERRALSAGFLLLLLGCWCCCCCWRCVNVLSLHRSSARDAMDFLAQALDKATYTKAGNHHHTTTQGPRRARPAGGVSPRLVYVSVCVCVCCRPWRSSGSSERRWSARCSSPSPR